MYSLILMTAMTAAPDTAEFGGLFRDLFHRDAGYGSSCYGGCYGSGSARSAGCYGSCDGGCCGGGFGSRLRAFFQRNNCYGSGSSHSAGCYGSCTGYGSYSCTGFAAGCQGLPPPGYDVPPPGMPGVPYAPPAPAIPNTAYLPADTGCCGTLGAPTPVGGYPGPFPAIPPAAAISVPSPMPPASVPEDRRRVAFAPPGTPTGETRARATVVVRLPADARLYAEGRSLTLTSAERSFVTPPLPVGPEYTYTFRAEYVRDGETITQTKRVQVRAGGSAAVEFADLTQARKEPTAKPDPTPTAQPTSVTKPAPAGPVASTPPLPGRNPSAPERARITVKLPPGATLYVDGRKNERTEPVREFSTPPLPPGQEFAYVMKAEVVRDGRPEYQLTKVTFRAGELVTVDFTAPPVR